MGASYWFGYIQVMEARELLSIARQAEGLTQETAARRAGTSQPTLSAYERGTKSPTLPVLERIVRALGYELDLIPHVTFREIPLRGQGRTIHVPDRLWRLHPHACRETLSTVLTGSRPYPMTSHSERLEAYIWLLEHGTPEVLLRHLDAALLLEYWHELTPAMHPQVVDAWDPLVARALDAWWIDQLAEGLAARQTHRPITQAAQVRAMRRMAGYGMSRAEILEVLKRRRL